MNANRWTTLALSGWVMLLTGEMALAQQAPGSSSPAESLTKGQAESPPKPSPTDKTSTALMMSAAEVAAMPEPALGLGFKGERVVNEMKLIEHGNDAQAIQIAKAALQEAINASRAVRDELRLEMALVYLRAGRLNDANEPLTQLSKAEVEDSAVRDTANVTRRALVLQTIGQCVKRTKDSPRPLAGGDDWKRGQELAAAALAAKAKVADKDLARHATTERWSDASTALRTARQHLEALDMMRGAVGDGVWSDAAATHAAALVEATASANTRTNRKIDETHELARGLQPARGPFGGWMPADAVGRYNKAVEAAVSARAAAVGFREHFDRAQAKWSGKGLFAQSPEFAVLAGLIPQPRKVGLADVPRR